MLRRLAAVAVHGGSQRPEGLGKGDLILLPELLVAQQDHAMAMERIADHSKVRFGQRTGQIDADDFGADLWRERPHLDPAVQIGGHRRAPA